MTLHRISTAAILAFGIVLLFLIIPDQVETVSYGWVRPRTVPNALAVLLSLCAAIQLLASPKAAADELPTPLQFARAVGFFAGVSMCAVLMQNLGFLPVAVAMALGLMLAVGERRLHWLVVGGAAVPAFIWYATEILLGRPLP